MNVADAILQMYPEADPQIDFEVHQEGGEQRIAAWNLDAPQPTRAELEAAWPDALREQVRAYIHRRAAAETEAAMPRFRRERVARDMARGRSPKTRAEVDEVEAVVDKAEALLAELDEAMTVAEIEGVRWG